MVHLTRKRLIWNSYITEKRKQFNQKSFISVLALKIVVSWKKIKVRKNNKIIYSQITGFAKFVTDMHFVTIIIKSRKQIKKKKPLQHNTA